ncbi:DUF4411 family protein [Cellulosimicrobium sp. BIT-GX5]|uniref:DUF4411 family protein n=1 Tax=Cellulosimicrobium composti TaxID=2672572 RepID=A0A6N7ZKK6_9MICO|nr:DUF4411 family protein [Cellulosimicrobium composti]MTG89880.1 DUF4411 family protein [Cellulosimicrobium composti]
MTGFYSFDTSTLLNGQRDLLPPTTFPAVWERIEQMIGAGRIRAIDLVREELAAREDEVHAWSRAQPDLFVELTHEVQLAVRSVLAQHQRLIGIGSGRSGADPFVIALALVHDGVVVTEENPSRNLARPKIPDVCQAMGVRQLNLLGFIQEQGWVFR